MKHTKIILILAMLVGSMPAAFSQTGIRAGINMASRINSLSFKEIGRGFTAGNLTCYQLGVVQQFMNTSKTFGGEIALMLSQKGYTYDYPGENSTTVSAYREFDFLEIPVNLKFRLPLGFLSLLANGGFYGAYALTGKNVIETTPEQKEKIKYNHFYEHLDYGYNLGIGIELFSKVQIGGVWSQGLKNISDNQEDAAINRVFSINITYLF